MAKNYAFTPDYDSAVPRPEVIQRILHYSKTYFQQPTDLTFWKVLKS